MRQTTTHSNPIEKGELGIAVVQLRSALEESNSNLAEGEKRVRELVEGMHPISLCHLL